VIHSLLAPTLLVGCTLGGSNGADDEAVDQLVEDQAATQARLDELETQLADAVDALAAADQTIEDLRADLDALEAIALTTETDVLTSGDLVPLEMSVTDLDDRVTNIEGDYLTSADQVDTTQLAADLVALTSRVSFIEADYLTAGSLVGYATEDWVRNLIGDTSPSDRTVYEVRDGTIALGTVVTLQSVHVTQILSNRFVVQEPTGGPEAAIEVFTGFGDAPDVLFPFLEIGDVVDVTAPAGEFGGDRQLDYDGADPGDRDVVEVTDQAPPLAPDVVPVGTFATDITAGPWLFGLVEVQNVTVAALDGPDLIVEDGAGDTVVVDDFRYGGDWANDLPGPCVGATLAYASGTVDIFNGLWRIYPRDLADLGTWDTSGCTP